MALPMRKQPDPQPPAPHPGYWSLLRVLRQALLMILGEVERQMIDAGHLARYTRQDKRGQHKD